MRIAAIALLAGCAPIELDTVRNTQGQPVEVAWVVPQPLCLILCSQTISTVGSDTDTIGGTTSNTQTATASSGATVQ